MRNAERRNGGNAAERGAERRSERAEAAESHEQLIELSDKEITDAIHQSEMESERLFEGVEADLGGDAPLDFKDFMTEAQRKLAENSAEMRRVAEEARAEAEQVMEVDASEMVEVSPEEELAMKVAELMKVAEKNPHAAMDVLVEAGEEVTFEQKMTVVRTALDADPSVCAKFDALGLTEAEKRAAVMPFLREQPMIFFAVMDGGAIAFTPEEKKALTQDVVEEHPQLFSEAVDRFALSHDDVVDVIGAAHPDARETLLAALKIPTEQGTKPHIELTLEELAWFATKEETKEAREIFEQVETVNKASRELMLAVTSAFPERAQAERERLDAEQMLRRRIMRVGEIGAGKSKDEQSANKPLYVTLDGKPLPACYKPKSREMQTRTGIAEGEAVGREVLAAFIDRALKLDIVPPTVLRDGPEGIGTVQDWKVGKIAMAVEDPSAEKHSEQLMRVAFFDWLTTNSDRHMGNWMISPDGKHQAIDNGSIFGKRVTKFDGLRSVPSYSLAGQPLTPELRKAVEDLAGSKEVMKALKKGFETTLNKEDAERSWKEFAAKLEQVRQDKDFAIQNSEWLDFTG